MLLTAITYLFMNIISLLFFISMTFAGAFISCSKSKESFHESECILNGKIDKTNSDNIFDIKTLVSVGVYCIGDELRESLINSLGSSASGTYIQKVMAHSIFKSENPGEEFDLNSNVDILKIREINKRLNDFLFL